MITMVGGYDQHQAVQAAESGKFIATEWATPLVKADCLLWLQAFMGNGCGKSMWHKKAYRNLSQHLFGHIAHYNMDGFWHTWFEKETQCHIWVDNIAERTVYGDPAWTWSDVEAAIKIWLAADYVLPYRRTDNLTFVHLQIEDRFKRAARPIASPPLVYQAAENARRYNG